MATHTQVWRKKWRRLKVPLIPFEWHGIPKYDALGRSIPAIPDWKPLSKEARQAHFAGCYGNIYSRVLSTYSYNPITRQSTGSETPENHMFLGCLVGNGAYTTFFWLDMQNNRKWEETVHHAGDSQHNWRLMSELNVGQ